MDSINLIGTIAAACTTMAFFPQVIKAFRTKHAKDLSLPMYIIFSFGVISWIIYGFLTRSMPIIIANIVTFILCIFILSMKVKYK